MPSISGIIRVEPQLMVGHMWRGCEYIRDYQSRTPAHLWVIVITDEYIRDYQSRTPAGKTWAHQWVRVYQGLSESNPSPPWNDNGHRSSISGIIRVEPQPELRSRTATGEYIRDYQSRTPAISATSRASLRVYQGLSESNPSIGKR